MRPTHLVNQISTQERLSTIPILSTNSTLPDARPPVDQRRFVSPLVEEHLAAAASRIRDPDVRQLFMNTYPNTLDTTVFSVDLDLEEPEPELSKPLSWVITGDIPATWLRDGANQVIPYLTVLSSSKNHAHKDWIELYRFILGVVYSQATCVLHHPYSNAFIPPTSTVEHDNEDVVHPPPPPNAPNDAGKLRVWESKWELDSLVSFLDLSVKLAQASGRTDFVHSSLWRDAVRLVISTCKLQQRGTTEEGTVPIQPGVYRFQRATQTASETRSLSGLGEPARRCGMIKSAFRPSDDATVFQFLIPSNAFASVALIELAGTITKSSLDATNDSLIGLSDLAKDLKDLGEEVRAAVWAHGVVEVPKDEGKEKVFAYEVDGYGSFLIADDANIPSLLSLPHLGFTAATDLTYEATRRLVLSERNKWFFTGKVASGVGGMHIGLDYVWPMAIIMRALTSDDDEEILDCVNTLARTTADTGLIHESFNVNNASDFTRSHFSWANGLNGQLCLHLLESRPYLL